MVDYAELEPVKSIGGSDSQHDDNFLLWQSQHILANEDLILVTMLGNRNIRALNKEDGTFNSEVSSGGFKENEFQMAAGMSFYKDDQLLVADLNGNKISAFSMNDFSFVGLPLSQYKFNKPNCIRTDGENNIYIGEVGDKKLRCFDADLKEKFLITQAGGQGFQGVDYVSFDAQQKRILATDSEGNGVHVYSTDASYLFSIRDAGDGPGQLAHPTGTTVDNKGNILVCDTGNSRVQVFDNTGKFISIFGKEDTFKRPMDIHMTENDEVVVVDGSIFQGWSRVRIFKY